jgi:transcriptional antiterminator NusG
MENGEVPVAKQWFIVHTYSGYEQKVKNALEERIKALGKAELFAEILVPTEKVVELVKGERKTSARKFYPGYILVRMELSDETWHIVKDTPKVTGFIGGQGRPTPLNDEEAQRIIDQMTAGALKPKPKYAIEHGDEVRVIDGPFLNFNGVVDEVNPEKGKVRVLVSIFGRSTPVELDFVQVTKI